MFSRFLASRGCLANCVEPALGTVHLLIDERGGGVVGGEAKERISVLRITSRLLRSGRSRPVV